MHATAPPESRPSGARKVAPLVSGTARGPFPTEISPGTVWLRVAVAQRHGSDHG